MPKSGQVVKPSHGEEDEMLVGPTSGPGGTVRIAARNPEKAHPGERDGRG